jgi:hypothetical protein
VVNMTDATNTQAESTETQEVKPLTPYGAAKLVNARLEAEGLAKRVRPQMMHNYTYARIDAGEKPLIAASRETGVDREDLDRWFNQYLAKQFAALQEASEVDEESVEDEASEVSEDEEQVEA